VKTNPNKANFKRDDGFSAYYTRDFQSGFDIDKAENLQKETVQLFALHSAVGFAILTK